MRKYLIFLLIYFTFQLEIEGQIFSRSVLLPSLILIENQSDISRHDLFVLKSVNSDGLYFFSNYIKKTPYYKLPFSCIQDKSLNFKSEAISSIHFYTSYIPPVILMTVGLFTLKEEGFLNKYSIQNVVRNAFPPDFHTKADNYLQFAPIPVVYLMDLTGIKPEHDLIHRTILLGSGEILMEGIVQTLKYSTHELRPDGSDDHSFPSGHTAQAFLAATFMHKELGKRSIWFSVGAYSCATVVGVLRMANNRHYISDVLFGAGLGILSMNTVYDLDKIFSRRARVNAHD